MRGGQLFLLAPGPHPRRELTLMPRFGFACPRLGMAAGAACRSSVVTFRPGYTRAPRRERVGERGWGPAASAYCVQLCTLTPDGWT